jgi:adenosylmethionine-8-amino-7-oxononanoate aminotransferase
VFFSDDGSTAVESALKMALQHWRNRGERERTLFVALEHGYHGDTFGAMAAGAGSVFHDAFRPLFFPVVRSHAPYCYRCPLGLERARCDVDCAQRLEELLSAHEGKVAAVIIEPMLQGAGGMIVGPGEFLRKVRSACDRHDVLLIADEVLTGFGRTGRLFACEHGPIAPDIMCLSKALTGGYLPLAATLATEAIYESFLASERSRAFLHGHSYTANPLACAVALESLAVLEEERGLERAQALERLYRARLPGLAQEGIVGDTRAIGMVAAIELVRDRATKASGGYLDDLGPRLQREFLARDLLLRPLGNVLYVLPPLCVTDEEVHRVFDRIEEVLRVISL